jgi:DNA-binding XRE family transcriptional regulator
VGIHKVRAKNSKKIKAFGSHVKKLRLTANLTQEQLADEAKISLNTVNTLEAGKLNVSIATCFEIAKALKVDTKELFDFRA